MSDNKDVMEQLQTFSVKSLISGAVFVFFAGSYMAKLTLDIAALDSRMTERIKAHEVKDAETYLRIDQRIESVSQRGDRTDRLLEDISKRLDRIYELLSQNKGVAYEL